MASVIADTASKAAVLDAGMVHMSVPIEKAEDTDEINPVDGTPDVVVTGKCTDGTLDSDLQVVDPEASARWIKTWFDTGANIRAAHDPKWPAGRGLSLDPHDPHRIKVLVADPRAKHLVRQKVLKDFSIGIMHPDVRKGDPRFRHLDPQGKAVNGVITDRPDGLTGLGEISLVDRGANFGSAFSLVKAAADGSPEWVGEMVGDTGLLTKDADPGTVTVELPRDVSVSISPSDLAKLATFKQRLTVEKAAGPGPAAVSVPEPAAPPPPEPPGADVDLPVAVKTLIAAEGAVYKRDIDTATRRRLAAEGKALPNLSYPIENEEDLHNAATLARSGHGNVAAARRLIGRRAKDLGVANPLKGGKKGKADKAASVSCEICKNTGRTPQGPCPACPKGTKAAKADARIAKAAAAAEAKTARKAAVAERRQALAAMVAEAVAEADAEAVKKDKVLCPSCGARQNAKHKHCPECGNMLPGDALQVRKNHDFTCLHCGKTLDKGEKFCPECGHENPGYLPEADRKIPANHDADKAAKGKKNPFGGRKAPPFGHDDDDDDSPPKKGKKGARVAKAVKKGRTPGDGVVGQHESPVPRHREPDGPDVEAFEADAGMSDGDSEPRSHLAERMGKGSEELDAAMRLKSLNVPHALGVLHDLTCPAYDPADVAKAHPGASLGAADLSAFGAQAIDSAATMSWEDLAKGTGLFEAAAALKAADPFELNQAREHAYKSFRELNPGPSTFPTPGQISATQFRRPLITAGHEAPSPGHDGPNTAHVPPPGGMSAADYHRPYISAGHASESPSNQHTPGPVSAPSSTGVVTGEPARYAFERGAQASHEHAMRVIHDHISGIYPGLCPAPLSPDPVPTPHGVPPVAGAPTKKKTVKAPKPLSPAQAAKKTAAKRARLERQVLKGQLSVTEFREKIGLTPVPVPQVPGLDPDQVKAAVADASAPLNKRLAKQGKALRQARKAAASRDKMIRKQRKTLKALTAAAAEATAAQAVPETAEDPAVTGMLLKSAMADATAPLRKRLAKQDRALKAANKATAGQDKILKRQHKMLLALSEPGPQPQAAEAEPDMRAALMDLVLKTTLSEVTAPLQKQLRASQKAQKRQAKELKQVRRTADAIASQPDTTGAPFRGVALTKNNNPGTPEGPLSVAKSAEQIQANFMAHLADQWRNDPNPAVRQAAFDDILARTLDPQATQPPA